MTTHLYLHRPAPISEALVIGTHRAGDMVGLGRHTVKVLRAIPRKIQDDDPSAYGDHLRGHEGEIGTIVWYQPVSVEEGE